jgi:hypothetical protein
MNFGVLVLVLVLLRQGRGGGARPPRSDGQGIPCGAGAVKTIPLWSAFCIYTKKMMIISCHQDRLRTNIGKLTRQNNAVCAQANAWILLRSTHAKGARTPRPEVRKRAF